MAEIENIKSNLEREKTGEAHKHGIVKGSPPTCESTHPPVDAEARNKAADANHPSKGAMPGADNLKGENLGGHALEKTPGRKTDASAAASCPTGAPCPPTNTNAITADTNLQRSPHRETPTHISAIPSATTLGQGPHAHDPHSGPAPTGAAAAGAAPAVHTMSPGKTNLATAGTTPGKSATGTGTPATGTGTPAAGMPSSTTTNINTNINASSTNTAAPAAAAGAAPHATTDTKATHKPASAMTDDIHATIDTANTGAKTNTTCTNAAAAPCDETTGKGDERKAKEHKSSARPADGGDKIADITAPTDTEACNKDNTAATAEGDVAAGATSGAAMSDEGANLEGAPKEEEGGTPGRKRKSNPATAATRSSKRGAK